ncbi:MAG: HAMP domain-containing histidine kinase [Tannerellaceae bacterium]|jgi:signal transduction histidine kinase|nr:HAMP domain-containing histidine kinase [Tannerellaceae bacterium]
MKTERHTALRYTAVTVTAVSLGVGAFLLLWGLLPPLPVWGRAVLFLVFLFLNALGVYRLARGYAGEMSAKVESARQSEKSFISNASHELNNPLTAIQGECEISLRRERSVAEYQASLGRIASETQRIILLMKHLMFLSRGKEEILRTDSETIILAEFMMQFMERRICFAPDNFAFMIHVNPHLLRMALGNILANALKYSGDKTVDIRLRGSVMEIRDRGMGIPPEELPRIFQPFYRASNTRTYTGNGIGLSLAGRILGVYGAELSLTSVLNEGTNVRIDFRHVR